MAPIVTGSCLPSWHARPGVVPFLAAPVGWFAGSWNAESIFLREEAEVLDFSVAPVLDVLGPGFEHARALVSDLVVAPSADLIGRTYPQGPPAAQVSIPVLHRGGWWDNIKGSQLDDWHAVQQAPARGSQFLEMAAMDHYSEPFSLTSATPAVEETTDDDVELVAGSATQFLEHHLGVRVVAPRARVRAEIANAGWVELDTWPPAAERTTWHLDDAGAAVASADGGALRPLVPRRETTGSWAHDPGDLVPSLTVNDFHVLPQLPDESEVHARRDVATFTTDELGADLDILGDVGAVLEVRASCPALPLIVALHHVRDRRATVITEGSASAFVGSGWTTVPVDLGAVGYRVPRGDRIRISVSASRFPRYLPPSGTVGSDWLASERRRFDITLRAGSASRVLLPLLEPWAAP